MNEGDLSKRESPSSLESPKNPAVITQGEPEQTSLLEKPRTETIGKFEELARNIGYTQQPLDDGKTLMTASFPRPDTDGKIKSRSDKRQFTFSGVIDSETDADDLYPSKEIRAVRSEDGTVSLDWVSARYKKDPAYPVYTIIRRGEAQYKVLEDRVKESDLLAKIAEMQKVLETKDVLPEKRQDTMSEETSSPHVKKKHWRRRITAGVTAVAAGVALRYGVLPQFGDESYNRPTSIEQIDTNKQYPPGSLDAIVASLEHDGTVAKDTNSIDLLPLQNLYKNEDYKIVKNPLNKNGSREWIGSLPTAPLLEVTYDKTKNAFNLDSTKKYEWGNDTTYHLLSPLVKNIALKTAFTSGSLDRVVVQLSQKDPNEEYANLITGKFITNDRTDPEKGKQRSLFLFLPYETLNHTEYKVAITHESEHAITSKFRLSGYNKEQPLPQEFDQWQNVCSSIQDIAVDQAEQHSQELVAMMEENKKYFKDEKVRAVFQEVEDALRRGDFNQYQKQTPDYESEFLYKIPNCSTLGPWDAFNELLKIKQIKYEPESEAIGNLQRDLIYQWDEVAINNTIFRQLREGPAMFADGARNDQAGHPYQEWDELIASVSNLILLYPQYFGQTINKLSPHEKAAAVRLVDTAVKTLDAQVPADQMDYHIVLRTQYAMFQKRVK